MREAILAVVILGCGVGSLLNPRIGILAWIWYSMMRPDFLAYASFQNNYSALLAGTTLLGALRYYPRWRTWALNPVCIGLIVLVFLVFLSMLFAVVRNDEISVMRFNYYWRMILVVLTVPILLRSTKDLRIYLTLIGISVGVIGLKFGSFGLFHSGVRFAAGYGGFMSDNNSLASAMVTTLPICWYMRYPMQSRPIRALMAAMSLGMVTTIVMTFSRGGALGLTAVCLLILLRSQKRLQMLLALAVICVIPVYLVGQSYMERLSTMKTPEEEKSAHSRVVFARAAFEMWKDYPLFGVGFGMRNEQFLLPKYVEQDGADYGSLVLHNTYLQVLVDCGIFAFGTFILLLFGTIVWLYFSIRRTRREHPGYEVYPIAIQTSLVGFAVTGTFLSESHVDFLYIILIAAALWFECRRSLGTETAEIAETDQPVVDMKAIHPIEVVAPNFGEC